MMWHPAFTLVVLAATTITCAVVVFAGVAGGPAQLARVLLFTLPALVGISAAALFASEVGWGRLPGVPPALTFVLGMALMVGAAMAAVGTWWAVRLAPAQGMWPAFDEAGMAPVAYCLFAAAAGSAFGALTVRVLPATLLTLGTFAGVRLVVALVLRPRFRPPVLGPADQSTGAALPPDSWLQHTPAWTIVDPAGHQVTNFAVVCGGPVAAPCPLTTQAIHNAGLVQRAWYQPADRFWTFHGIEAGIFVLLTMVLALLAAWLLSRRQRQRT
jgi:hypothetical protein